MTTDKQPGIGAIAIGQVSRCIISKAILSVAKSNVMEIASSIQLCMGSEFGCEAAVHAIIEDESTEPILLVNAQNAFNLLNGQLALLNIHRICPSITNLYQEDANLYVQNETVISERVSCNVILLQ